MAGPITIEDGGLATKDPADESVYQFNWDTRFLAVGVTITTSTFTIIAVEPLGDTALTKDSESIVTGNRRTQLRLLAGTVGAKYRINNLIVTNETPSQKKERSFFVKVEQKSG